MTRTATGGRGAIWHHAITDKGGSVDYREQPGTRGKREKVTRKRSLIGAIALFALTASVIGTISASADRNGGGNRANKFVGSWMVSVDRPGLPPLKSLQTNTKGHGVIEIANGGAAARSPAHGAWKRVGPRRYAVTNVFFRYDPGTGAYLGTVKLRMRVRLAPDGQAFTGVAVAELRNPAGDLLPGSNTRQDSIAGERINVEPIPIPVQP